MVLGFGFEGHWLVVCFEVVALKARWIYFGYFDCNMCGIYIYKSIYIYICKAMFFYTLFRCFGFFGL